MAIYQGRWVVFRPIRGLTALTARSRAKTRYELMSESSSRVGWDPPTGTMSQTLEAGSPIEHPCSRPRPFAQAAIELRAARPRAEASSGATRQSNRDAVLEASPFGQGLIDLVNRTPRWAGSCTELLEKMNTLRGEGTSKGWPANARAVRSEVEKVAPALRSIGIDVEFARTSRDRKRQVTLSKSAGAVAEQLEL